MEITLFVILGVIMVTVIYAVLLYNNLVALKHGIAKAWSNIDILLKQRHDELPKLVETCKQYMRFEKDTLERVMLARSAVAAAQAAGDVGGLGNAEGALRLGLGSLFAVAEAYPELKANEAFQDLRTRITGLENSIADRREFYNEAVNRNNVRIEQFPDVIIANWFGFKAGDLLEFAAEEMQGPDMRELFGQPATGTDR